MYIPPKIYIIFLSNINLLNILYSIVNTRQIRTITNLKKLPTTKISIKDSSVKKMNFYGPSVKVFFNIATPKPTSNPNNYLKIKINKIKLPCINPSYTHDSISLFTQRNHSQ